MKKILLLALTLVFVFAFFACTSENDVDVNDENHENDENENVETYTNDNDVIQVFQMPTWPINTNPVTITDDMTVITSHGSVSGAGEFAHLMRGTTMFGDRAFRGVALSERAAWVDDNGIEVHIPQARISTATKLLVLESFCGIVQPGDIVELWQSGGVIDDQFRISRHRVDMPIGEEFLVFARDFNVNMPHLEEVIIPVFGIGTIFWIANPDDGRGMGAMTDESVIDSTALILGDPDNFSFDITPENMAELAEHARSIGIDVGAPIPAEVMEIAQVAIDQRTEDLARWEAEQRAMTE